MQDFIDVLDHQDSLRTIQLDNGSTVNIKRTDPYGFWSIHYEKGQVPQNLSGSYTSDTAAIEALKSYLSTKNLQEISAEDAENKKKKVSGS